MSDKSSIILVGMVLLLVSQASFAVTINLGCITSNDPTFVACNSGESFFSVDVTSVTDNTTTGNDVLFTFFNTDPNTSNTYFISDIYFDTPGTGSEVGNTGVFVTDTGSLLRFVSLVDLDDTTAGLIGDPGVDFDLLVPNNPNGNNTPNLPSANSANPDFDATLGFAFVNGNAATGVQPGESLGIVFELHDMQTLADVIAELADGSLRIGIHGQGFPGSESFVSTPVPVPAAAWLFGSAVIGLFGFKRNQA